MFRQKTKIQKVGFVLGLILFILVSFILPENKITSQSIAGGVALLMAVWWITEAIPIYYTSCVPLIIFPFSAIYSNNYIENFVSVIIPYLDPYIFLFAGGMCIAAAMQQWNLHKRISLQILSFIGTQPSRLLFGFLASTAFISLWISNTATATMMLPIAMAVISQLESKQKKRLSFYGAAIALSIAYASNIGGIGTKIGTAPNMQLTMFMHDKGIDITFLQFMAIGLPFVIMLLPVAWFTLWQIGKKDLLENLDNEFIKQELRELGSIKKEEKIVLVVFLITALLWMFGKPITDFMQIYFQTKKITSAHVEGSTAVLAAVFLFLFRSEKRFILEFHSLKTVPWGTLVLLGGGLAMASAIQQSKLTDLWAANLSGIKNFTPFLQILFVSLITVSMSAVTSNTATIGVMLPLLYSISDQNNFVPILFASTISASCDFALPAGTPPNAIVFGSGYITIPQMVKSGIVLDIFSAVLAATWSWGIIRFII